MATFRTGAVVRVDVADDDLVRAVVRVDDGDVGEVPAVAFPPMTGPLHAGDRVVVNTTGIELGLGTGGDAFVLWNLDGAAPDVRAGHVVKLRYTPWQTNVVAVEAPESPHHDVMRELESLDGTPVVACSLHSQLAGVAAGVKARAPGARVGYLMTDGAALPLAWSELVRTLTRAGLVDVTCTSGHAFGGDLEAVTDHSGLAALRAVGGADVVVAAMGPGIVGTGTRLGYTGLEQGRLLDAAHALGGVPVACVRVSFADERARHAGVSHHTLTALRIAARERATVVLPALDQPVVARLRAALDDGGVAARHDVVVADGGPGVELLRERGIEPASMGRPIAAAPEPFLAAAAAGAHAAAAVA